MGYTHYDLAAIFAVARYIMHLDDNVSDEETDVLRSFFNRFNLDAVQQGNIVTVADGIDSGDALAAIKALDDETKQEVSDFFMDIASSDGDLDEKESQTLIALMDQCDLPIPTMVKRWQEEHPEEAEEEEAEEEDPGEDTGTEDDSEKIIPAFILANFYGVASLIQKEDNFMEELPKEINADRLEVVRYTPALNELSKQLGLRGKHLVFLMDRDIWQKTSGDNMTGTILYGRSGYEIMGDIIFALEDDKYEICGFETLDDVNAAFNAINNRAGGLLRIKE